MMNIGKKDHSLHRGLRDVVKFRDMSDSLLDQSFEEPDPVKAAQLEQLSDDYDTLARGTYERLAKIAKLLSGGKLTDDQLFQLLWLRCWSTLEHMDGTGASR